MATGTMPTPPVQKKPSISSNFSPASASTAEAISAWIWATDRSGMTRSGCSYAPTMYALPLILTSLRPRCNFHVHLRQGLDFLERKPVGHLLDDEFAVCPTQDRQVGDHHVHAGYPCNGVRGPLNELRSIMAIAV